MESFLSQQPSSQLQDDEFVVLPTTEDPESFATFQMSLLGGASQTEAQQLALKMCQVTQQCSWLHADLMKHRGQMEALRDQWRERQQQLDRREKQLERVMKHYVDQESARQAMQADLLRRRAQCDELADALRLAKSSEEQMRLGLEAERAKWRTEAELAARRQAASVEAERVQFLAQLEGFGRQRKQLERLGECSERQADEMAAAIEQLSALPANHRDAVRQLKKRVAELEAQAADLKSQLAVKNSTETAGAESKAGTQSGQATERQLDSIDEEGGLAQSQKFVVMASKELKLLESQESLKEQLRSQTEERDRILAETQRLQEAFRAAEQHHQMELQSIRKCSQFKEAKLKAAEKQVQELAAEIKRLAASEKELNDRCLESNRAVSDILAGAENDRRDMQSQLAMMTSKVSNNSEALKDYAEKMKHKAAVEFELKSKIRELTVQLDNLKRNSAPPLR